MSDDFLTGMAELNSITVDLGTADARAGARASLAVRKTAADIEATGMEFAPVDTGNLMNSIGTDLTGDGRSGVIEAEIGPTVDYGAYVEFGTSVHAPAAYMGPAFDRHAHQLEDALGQVAGDTLGG